MKFLINTLLLSILILSFSVYTQQRSGSYNPDVLKVNFDGDAKIEVGGPYVGIEMHHSSPLLQRVSFFYPAANSLDESTDYWKRDTSFVMQLGIKVGDNKKEIIKPGPFPFILTPYSVEFFKSDSVKSINISYRFTKNKPAMVIRFEIKNELKTPAVFEFYSHLETALRTSHTFKLVEKAWTEYDQTHSAIYTNFDDPGTQSAQIFVANAGDKPTAFNTRSSLTGLMNPDRNWWEQQNVESKNNLTAKDNPARPNAEFLYRKELEPGGSMVIIQIVGSCKQSEGKEFVSYLVEHYNEEINAYENSIFQKISGETEIISGDTVIDQSIAWAKGILEANTHYLDNEFVPMPCPAEYNFYFTHDVLKTDLAAVNFDISRVKRDLDFIIRHASKDRIIPHAYYWKDSAYLTELADHDNWNNFWFIICAGSYLRHSGDTTFLRTLYPYIQKSLNQALLTKGPDDLMWSNRPDWWDIGKLYGSKSYMTILAIKAIREYLFISTILRNDQENLAALEGTVAKMQQQLNTKLWDDNLKYLINYYEPGKPDHHYYIGPLLAAHYDILDKQKVNELVTTAGNKLLDKNTGVYDAFPMDFDELGDYLHFAGNEAGDKFFYANGGIWPHGNAWYALALMADGKKQDAFEFIKRIMTVKGVMAGPNGQPAMYEVRNGNYNDKTVYGTVDKPSFLWAGGWYLYSLYHLFAVEENEWNISLSPFNPNPNKPVLLDMYISGNKTRITVSGEGPYINRIICDGKLVNSAVLPSSADYENIELVSGIPDSPYLESCRSSLSTAVYDPGSRTLSLELKSFTGHNDEVTIVSPSEVSNVFMDNAPLSGKIKTENVNNVRIIKFPFVHNSSSTNLKVVFK